MILEEMGTFIYRNVTISHDIVLDELKVIAENVVRFLTLQE